MKKNILWILVLILALITIGAFAVKQSERLEDGVRDDATAYFYERMVTLAIDDIGMAIEGFDPNLLLIAYPGLVPADFAGVEALEGVYEVRGEEIVFIRNTTQPISSAERTVSEAGYSTLLSNLGARMGVSTDTKLDVDNLIEKINTAERISVKIGESGSEYGFTLTPTEVIEDSRCPIDVTCIQAGTLRLRSGFVTPTSDGSRIFELEKPIIIENWEITLMQVDPAPESTREVGDSDYVFYFRISTRVN